MNIRRTKGLVFVLLLFFTISSGLVYELGKSVNNNTQWREAIVDLQFLNKEINSYFRRGLGASNYDDINSKFLKFQENFDKIKKAESFNVLTRIYGGIDDVDKVYDIFKRQIDIMNTFNYTRSSATAFLKGAEYMIASMKNTEMQNLTLRLRNLDFADSKSVSELRNSINDLRDISKGGSPANKDIAARLEFILENLLDLRHLYDKNSVLNLPTYLSAVSIAYEKQYQRLMYLLSAFALLSFLSFYLIFGFVFHQMRIHKSSLKEIARLKIVLDNAFSSILFTSDDNKVTYANDAFFEATGYTSKEIIGKNPNILKSNLHSAEFYKGLRVALDGHKFWSSNEMVTKTKYGEFIYEKVKFIPFEHEGKFNGFVGIKSDRTREARINRELEAKNKEIKEQSSIDKLTGFGNYFAMTSKLSLDDDETLKDIQDQDELNFGMIVNITIKNFDNLRFFYVTGIVNKMLKAFAQTLQLAVDTFDIRAELFRFQDDEFYLWYKGDDVEKDISHIQNYFNFKNIKIEIDHKIGNYPSLRPIIGISTEQDIKSEGKSDKTNRLMQAVLANRHARNNGLELYQYKENDPIEEAYRNNKNITELIEYALEEDKIVVDCQPIVDIKNQNSEPTYYEVLVRILDKDGRIRSPGEFLDIAMKAQLYTQITKKVIQKAFDLAERYPNYTFSINLSGLDIVDASVREFLEEKLQSCKDASKICFEILESVEVSDYNMVNSFIKHIKEFGAKISIDDFGSGYSNYYRILELDIDTIKIDGSIIKKLPYEANARYLVETIMNFASKQNYKVVAEFVSSEEILRVVKEFGIDYAQGFYLGKPRELP